MTVFAHELSDQLTRENLDALDFPVTVKLRPSDIRDLYSLVRAFPLKIAGLPNLEEWEAMVRMRRVREALDDALESVGLPPLDSPELEHGIFDPGDHS